MKAKSTPRARLLAAILGLGLASAFTLPATLSAQEVKTVPVGAINLTIAAASSPTAPRYVSLTLPLADGIIYKGRLASVTSNSITVSNTVVESFGATTPYILRLTSGSHKGRSFVITSNSGSLLNVDNQGTNIASLSPALNVGSEGDQFVIHLADTLFGVFGTQTQGASDPSAADQVWLWQSVSARYNRYFYNTSSSRWEDVDNDPANSVVIRPDAGIMYMRRGLTPLSLQLTGEVAVSETRIQVRDAGFTFVSSGHPVDNTLLGLGFHTQASWIKTGSPATSDQVWVWQPVSGRYNRYYYNSVSSAWLDVDDDPANSTVIAAGVPVMIKRAAVSGSTASTLVVNLPAGYNIN